MQVFFINEKLKQMPTVCFKETENRKTENLLHNALKDSVFKIEEKNN